MPRGGHARSGPPPESNSGRSDRRGLIFTALPSEGYDGEAPDFPLPNASNRELELWASIWETPQACVWVIQPWRWHNVAMWVRTFVLCEGEDATAADKNSMLRLADDTGLSVAGLKLNGWQIATDELAEKRLEKVDEDEDDPRGRFAVVTDGGT